MTRRPCSLSGWCLATVLPVLLFTAVSGWGEELHLEVTVLRQDGSTKTLVPVRADSPFKTGDAVALEVKANRGGYVALLSPGGMRLWPSQAGGHPMPAQAAERIPASGLIRLAAPSPTKLSLVFSPRPLDGSPRPESPAKRSRWLRQIVLREAKLEPGETGMALIFEGALGEAEKAVVELELRHP